jgi:carbonic anhydrase
MVEISQASGTGILVLGCADPRVNPHDILGLDSKTNSELIRSIIQEVDQFGRSVLFCMASRTVWLLMV